MGSVTPEELYQVYYSRIYQRVYGLIRHREHAEDVTQETFLKAVRALPKLQHTDHLFAWLYRIATNTVYDELRRRRLAVWQPLETDDTVLLQTPDPQEHYPTQELVRQTLAQLPTVYQRVLVLSILEGYSTQEIATLCGLSVDHTSAPEDITVTEQLAEAGKVLDIELLDHLIIGTHRFVSLKERLRW